MINNMRNINDDPNGISAKATLIKRKLMAGNLKMYGTSISITSNILMTWKNY